MNLMGYSEELDIIQNMKNLSDEVSNALESLSEVQPSIDEILELKGQFQELSKSTLDVVNQYQETLDNTSIEIQDLLADAKSQFKQVTDDVESLVNLEVDFESIKDKITDCLDLNNTLADLLSGTTVYMRSDDIVPVSQRKQYKTYYEVLSTSHV
jgi:DNA repair ATPase RecN